MWVGHATQPSPNGTGPSIILLEIGTWPDSAKSTGTQSPESGFLNLGSNIGRFLSRSSYHTLKNQNQRHYFKIIVLIPLNNLPKSMEFQNYIYFIFEQEINIHSIYTASCCTCIKKTNEGLPIWFHPTSFHIFQELQIQMITNMLVIAPTSQ